MLQIDPELLPPDPFASDEDKPTGPAALKAGSATARSIYEIWNGTRTVVIGSGPGAGKSTTVVDVVAHLAERANMSITIACPTRAQVVGLANRLARVVGTESAFVLGTDFETPLTTRAPKTVLGPGEIGLRTLASCVGHTRPTTDVLVFEEAWQTTWADAAIAANSVEQIIAIGDAGQIGPVITCPTEIFNGAQTAPHLPAPIVMASWPDTVRLHLPVTYRLGERATDIIAPLYDFEFTSARPHRFIALDGFELDEIESLPIPGPTSPYDVRGCNAVIRSVARILNGVYVSDDGEVPMTQEMVAVVVSHNAQEAAVLARLNAAGIENVVVGTADRLQGGEWPAVVALDPMFGYPEATDHAMSSGRLCVMLSRHQAHLTWVYDPATAEVFSGNDIESRKHRSIRLALQVEA